jgi:UDP-2,3-diacylglucosamine pyrophosphatase LpxH
VRALVISDTHFGAWTGEDILREQANLALLEPHLDVDEVIFLGDLFDFLFGSTRNVLGAAEGLLELLRERLQGKRFVFLAGNHDHHVVAREAEELLELELAGGQPTERRDGRAEGSSFRRFLERRLEGVDVKTSYPTYTFGGVLCTHGHYLDFYARRSGAAPGKLLARALWTVAVGGADHDPTIEEHEAVTRMLTGLLYTIAQLPNGTRAQRRVFAGFQRLEHAIRLGTAPARTLEHAGATILKRLGEWVGQDKPASRDGALENAMTSHMVAAYESASVQEGERRRRTGAPGGGDVARYALGQVTRPADPPRPSLEAFEKVVMHLGWARDTDKVVFAHTHRPIEDVRGPSGAVRYWNTGSWIYEPDLTSRQAYVRYLRRAWPGSVVLIDTDEPHPRLLRLREHLNPLHQSSH